MATSIIFEERVEIPLSISSLEDFRQWARSAKFPEQGRIDYIAGRIEVDMSPEDFFSHGTLKTEIARVLANRVASGDLGYLVTDRTRLSCPEADLSAEPDVVFVSHETLQVGRAKLVAKAGGEPDRYVELEGAADLVVEIVSDSSVTKDTQRLPKAYAATGVGEFWLVDARGEQVSFQIHTQEKGQYRTVETLSKGYQHSAVFGCGFRLDRDRDSLGNWRFGLRQKQ